MLFFNVTITKTHNYPIDLCISHSASLCSFITNISFHVWMNFKGDPSPPSSLERCAHGVSHPSMSSLASLRPLLSGVHFRPSLENTNELKNICRSLMVLGKHGVSRGSLFTDGQAWLTESTFTTHGRFVRLKRKCHPWPLDSTHAVRLNPLCMERNERREENELAYECSVPFRVAVYDVTPKPMEK